MAPETGLYPVARLSDYGCNVGPAELFAHLFREMADILRLWDSANGIGEIMAACTDEAIVASQQWHQPMEMTPALAAIGNRIAKTYTMVAERNIHAAVFGDTVPADETPAASDDDLLEDALF